MLCMKTTVIVLEKWQKSAQIILKYQSGCNLIYFACYFCSLALHRVWTAQLEKSGIVIAMLSWLCHAAPLKYCVCKKVN